MIYLAFLIFLCTVCWVEFHYSFLCHCLEESMLFLVGSWVMIPSSSTQQQSWLWCLCWLRGAWKYLSLWVWVQLVPTQPQTDKGSWVPKTSSLIKVNQNILTCSDFPLVDFHTSQSWGGQTVILSELWSRLEQNQVQNLDIDISINWNTKYALDSFSYSITRYWRIYELSAKGEKWCSMCHWQWHNKLSCELSVCITLMLGDLNDLFI